MSKIKADKASILELQSLIGNDKKAAYFVLLLNEFFHIHEIVLIMRAYHSARFGARSPKQRSRAAPAANKGDK